MTPSAGKSQAQERGPAEPPPAAEALSPLRRGPSEQTRVMVALLAVYLIWGSGYLATRIALEGIPPFLMAGSRQLFAGSVLYCALRIGGAPNPTRAQWLGSAKISLLLMCVSSGGNAFAQQWVESGVAAVAFATAPIWTALFAGFLERWPTRSEWAGLALGLLAVVLLNAQAGMRGYPLAAVVLMAAAMGWGLGSVLSRHVALPPGTMASSSVMICGGTTLLTLGVLSGEHLAAMPALRSVAAFGYLAVFSSLLGFSAFTYLLHHTRPALAISHAYVNPVVAVVVGALFAGEVITRLEVAAIALTIVAVFLLTSARGELEASPEPATP